MHVLFVLLRLWIGAAMSETEGKAALESKGSLTEEAVDGSCAC